MALDPDVVAALEASVEAAPDSIPLRLHLADVLVEAGRPSDALRHAAVVLGTSPGHDAALAIVARATLALSVPPGTPDQTAEPAEPVATYADAPDLDADEFDDFLREVVEGGAVDVERSTVTLADVGGLEDVKRRLTTSFLAPMRNPELRRMYGTSLRGGLLLYGPPGCGKTFLARAVAGELGARFVSVGLHDVLDMWLGKSEQNLHALFETARRNAPCVLFLDEVDALGQKRSHLSHSAGRNVVVQLLNELDSTRDDNEGVFVLGATNQPWDLDPAMRRPGRFDRMLLVLPPDEPARRAILDYQLRGRPVGDVDVAKLAARTDGYSGADLRLVCEAAAQLALEDSLATGNARPITMKDFGKAVAEMRPSTRPWFETAANYVMFANEGGTYDELLAYMRKNKLV
jgi:SpoVK/Ycf46/Vps4 family AAA+-type ATPase